MRAHCDLRVRGIESGSVRMCFFKRGESLVRGGGPPVCVGDGSIRQGGPLVRR